MPIKRNEDTSSSYFSFICDGKEFDFDQQCNSAVCGLGDKFIICRHEYPDGTYVMLGMFPIHRIDAVLNHNIQYKKIEKYEN